MTIDRIDAFGDYIHPITVLWLRRQKGWRGVSPLVVAMLVVLAIICLVLLNWENFDIETRQNIRYFGGVIKQAFLPLLLFFPFMMSIGPIGGKRYIEKTEPLFLLTALSDRDITIGLFLTGTVQGFFGFCCAALGGSFLFAMKIVSLEWVYFYPFLFFVFGLTISAVCHSINGAAKTGFQWLVLFVVEFFPMWIIMMGFFSPHWRELLLRWIDNNVPETFFSPLCVIPTACVFLPALFGIAWRLLNFNLARHRSFAWKLFVSFVVYGLWLLALTAFWFALWSFQK